MNPTNSRRSPAAIAGWVLTILPVLVLLGSAAAKLLGPAAFVEQFEALGWRRSLLLPLAVVEISCVVIYLVPPTAVLGAILLTGYLGGATAAGVRAGESFVVPVLLGVLLWLGLYLRLPRLRALVPLRRA